MQTVVVGDGWGEVYVPIIEKKPWTILLFGSMYATVAVGVMNLILAVIVDFAAQARLADEGFQLQAKEMTDSMLRARLATQCEQLDQSGSGCISRGELLEA